MRNDLERSTTSLFLYRKKVKIWHAKVKEKAEEKAKVNKGEKGITNGNHGINADALGRAAICHHTGYSRS